jgi:hypothetical protein
MIRNPMPKQEPEREWEIVLMPKRPNGQQPPAPDKPSTTK